MTNDKNEGDELASEKNTEQEENKTEQPLPVHNPFDPNDHRKITEEDLENEQRYKEALTERD